MSNPSRKRRTEAHNEEFGPAFAVIEHEAFERYLLELVKRFGIEGDRLRKKHDLKEEIWQLLDVELVGEFPDTELKMKYWNPVRDEEGFKWAFIWQDPTFFDQNFERRVQPEDMAGDVLMLFRGG